MKGMWMAAVLALAVAVCGGALAEGRMSIAQLHEDTDAYWDGAYEAYGREIAFHAPVYVPDVEAMPVLTVTWNTVGDMTLPEGIVLGNHDAHTQCFGKEEKLTRGYWETHYYYNPWSQEGSAWAETCFAENNPMSLADAFEDMQNLVDAVWGAGKYGVFPTLASVSPASRSKGEFVDFSGMPGYEAYTGKGVYTLGFNLTMHGVPVFMGASQGYRYGSDIKTLSGVWHEANIEVVNYLAPGNFYVAAATVYKETGAAVEDIPLCPFEDIKAEVERLIERGNIRHVYGLRLGYVVFLKQNERYDYAHYSEEMAAAEYLAVPTWIVECTYAKSATEKIMTAPAPPENEDEVRNHGDIRYRKLMINAQTGEAYDPYSAVNQRKYMEGITAPDIETW